MIRYFVHPGSAWFFALDPAEAMLLADELIADGWRELCPRQ
jgi:hypothetical protein